MKTTKLFTIPFSEKKLKILAVSADLEIKSGKNSQVVLEVELEGEAEKIQVYEPKVRRTDDELEITLEYEANRMVFVSFGRSKSLRVYKATITLPPTKEFSISTVSGDVNLSAPNCQDRLTLKAISGDANMSDVECQEIDLKTTSGDIRLRNVKAKNQLRVSLVSGDLLAQDISFREARMETVSGDIVIRELTDTFRSIQFKSVSGDLVINMPVLPPSRIEFSTLSGTIKVGQRLLKGVKGSVDTAPKPVATVRINTVSGSATLQAAREEQQTLEDLDLFVDLIKSKKATPEQVAEMMRLLGFEDETIQKVIQS